MSFHDSYVSARLITRWNNHLPTGIEITMIRIALSLLLVLSVAAQAATFWEWDWETLPTATGPDDPSDIWYQGNCFDKALGDPFSSIELSTKYVRTGTKSARYFTNGYYSNQEGRRACQWKDEYLDTTRDGVKVSLPKQRMEPRYGHDGTTGANGFQSWNPGHERWFRYSFYLPSDEGTFSYWNTGPYASKEIMIMQLMAANPYTGGASTTHELSFNLKGGPSIRVEGRYSIPSGKPGYDGKTEYPVDLGTLNLKKDAWNDIVFMMKPGYETSAENPSASGRVKVWLNCANWSSCTPSIDRDGRIGIVTMKDRYFKGGLYEHKRPEYNRIIAMYMDNIKIGIKGAETDAQMLAVMADTFGGTTPPPPPPPPTGSNLNVNNGAAIDTSQDPINFTVTGATDVVNCTMGSSTQSAARPVKWDYEGGTSGKFAGVDTTGFTSAGKVICYDLTYIGNPDISATSMTGSNVTSTSQTSLDHWGYTKGRRASKTASGAGTMSFVYGGTDTTYRPLKDEPVMFDTVYSCSGASCSDMYFQISYSDYSKTIRLAGQAGSLAREWTGTTEHYAAGTLHVVNYTLPDNTYRVAAYWQALENAPVNYRFVQGWKSTSGANLTLDLLSVVMRKSWTTKVYEDAVTFVVPDTQKPTLSNCSMGNVRNGEGTYTASLLCNADEIGGTDYAMITTSATVPSVADVKAATGAIWSSQKPATTTEISFEANGMSYQDLWGWIMRCDAADNCSTVAGVTFDDGVGPGQSKKIKFVSQVLRRAGVPFTGTVERMAVWTANPLTTLRQSELFTASNVSFTSGNFSSGAYTGDDVNALQPATTYYMSAADADSDPYWVVPFQIIIE